MRNALGLIETVGLAAAIDAADVAVKSANVTLIGMEYTKGDGMVVVKIEGDVGAVNAGVDAARQSASKIGSIYSYKVIPRPSDGLKIFLPNEEVIDSLEDVEDEQTEEQPMAETVLQLVEEEVQIEIVPTTEEALTQEEVIQVSSSEEVISCNLCEDPKCSRNRGELHMRCLHYLD